MVVAIQPAARVRALTAAIAALMLVGCMLLVSWHRATVIHGVCATHGDEIHLSRTQAEVALAASVDRAEAHVFAGGFVPQDGDHHCDLLATTASVAPPADGGDLVAHLDATLADAALPPAPALGAARYRLAPKTSPPA